MCEKCNFESWIPTCKHEDNFSPCFILLCSIIVCIGSIKDIVFIVVSCVSLFSQIFLNILIVLASTRKVEFDQTLAQLIHFVAGGTFLAGFFKAMLQTMPFKNPFDVWSLICKYSTARAWLLYYRKKKTSFNLRLSSACIVHLRTAKNFIKPKKV